MDESIVKFAGRRIIEAGVHVRRVGRAGDRGRLVVLPNGGAVGSNLLWGWKMAPELRKLGWRVTVVPPHLNLHQRRRVIAMERPDLILMIKGRHPLNRPSLYPGVPCVFILDDADYVLEDQAAQVIECCRDSVAVIAGNRAVGAWVGAHNADVEVVWVSHPVPSRRPRMRNAQRGSVVAWAHAAPWTYPIEAQFVQDVMVRVAQRRSVEFWLYGSRSADEWTRPIREAGATVRTLPFRRSYRAYLKSLEEVAVGLHPVCLENPFSHGKSFGKALSYMATDVVTVTHDACDHAEFFRHEVNGMVCDTVAETADSVVRLLDDPALRQRLVDRCHDDFVMSLSTPVAARKVDAVLSRRVGLASTRSC